MTVTPLYAAPLAILYLGLSGAVVWLRRKHGVGLGDGQVHPLRRAIRAHGNFAEYVPLALVMMALLEECGDSEAWLHSLGSALLAGRILHIAGLARSHRTSFGRFWGASLTFGVILIAALRLLLIRP